MARFLRFWCATATPANLPLEALLETEAAPPSSRAAPSGFWTRVRTVGPGLVFAMAAVGHYDLVSNTIGGATYGYSLLWTLALIIGARYVILESSARYVLVTGESLIEGYGRLGRWTVWLIFFFLLAKRHISNLAQILLIGTTFQLLAPLPFPWGAKAWALLFWFLWPTG